MTFSVRVSIAAWALAGTAVVAPGFAFANSAAVEYFRTRADRTPVPALLTQDERGYYRELFDAIDRSDWARVQALFAAKADGPLHQLARAEYYLAAGSPRIEGDALSSWLSRRNRPAPGRAGRRTWPPSAGSPPRRRCLPRNYLVSQPSRAKRIRPRESNDGTMPGAVRQCDQRADQGRRSSRGQGRCSTGSTPSSASKPAPNGAPRWPGASTSRTTMPRPIRSPRPHRTAPGRGSPKAGGPRGLPPGGSTIAPAPPMPSPAPPRSSDNSELTAAAHYWQSRALVRCRQPEKASAPLRQAARMDETLYGMLAAEQLGLSLPKTHEAPDFSQSDWQNLRDVRNVRSAVMLSRDRRGRPGRRSAAPSGSDRRSGAISAAVAPRPRSRHALDPAVDGLQRALMAARPNRPRAFPTPKWTPATGWQVDPALVYAHALQESVFRTAVTSPAGAQGPDADHARRGARSCCHAGRGRDSERSRPARGQPRLRPAPHADAGAIRPAPRACCPRSWPPTTPG